MENTLKYLALVFLSLSRALFCARSMCAFLSFYLTINALTFFLSIAIANFSIFPFHLECIKHAFFSLSLLLCGLTINNGIVLDFSACSLAYSPWPHSLSKRFAFSPSIKHLFEMNAADDQFPFVHLLIHSLTLSLTHSRHCWYLIVVHKMTRTTNESHTKHTTMTTTTKEKKQEKLSKRGKHLVNERFWGEEKKTSTHRTHFQYHFGHSIVVHVCKAHTRFMWTFIPKPTLQHISFDFMAKHTFFPTILSVISKMNFSVKIM